MSTPPRAARALQRIVVATDGSPDANRAVTAAARLAKAVHGELTILTIGGSISGAELRRLAGADGDLSATMKSAANKVLDQAQKCALRAGVTDVKLPPDGATRPRRSSTPSAAIRPIFLSSAGAARALSALLLGSVSQKLASLAPCAVMVVP